MKRRIMTLHYNSQLESQNSQATKSKVLSDTLPTGAITFLREQVKARKLSTTSPQRLINQRTLKHPFAKISQLKSARANNLIGSAIPRVDSCTRTAAAETQKTFKSSNSDFQRTNKPRANPIRVPIKAAANSKTPTPLGQSTRQSTIRSSTNEQGDSQIEIFRTYSNRPQTSNLPREAKSIRLKRIQRGSTVRWLVLKVDNQASKLILIKKDKSDPKGRTILVQISKNKEGIQITKRTKIP